MKKYHVYGMGNALVDYEFQVPESLIQRLSIEKGTMTLIEEHDLLTILGELDERPHLKAGGGSAANTMITLARLGATPYYSCKVANDKMGDFYHQDLLEAGVYTNQYHCVRPQGMTGRCIVLLTEDAERTMCTHLGITASFSTDELVESELAKSEYLYIEGYLIASPSAREAMHVAKAMAKKQGVKIAFSLSDPNMTTFFREELLAVIGDGVDLLFCNHKEAMDFCEVNTLSEAIVKLQSYAKQFAITEGSNGSHLFDGSSVLHLPAYEVNVVDTLGAGDAYSGAFLYALTQGFDFKQCGQMANQVAAQIVSKLGPRLTQQEANQLKEAIEVLREASCTVY